MSNVSSPSTLSLVGPLALGALVIAATGALSGCSAVENMLHRVHEEDFPDRAAAESGWVGVSFPEWIPADATDLHNLATTDESHAIVRVDSSDDLPADCAEQPRRGLPFDGADWAPSLDPMPTTVWGCGRYEVVPVEGGWFGWFAATEVGGRPD